MAEIGQDAATWVALSEAQQELLHRMLAVCRFEDPKPVASEEICDLVSFFHDFSDEVEPIIQPLLRELSSKAPFADYYHDRKVLDWVIDHAFGFNVYKAEAELAPFRSKLSKAYPNEQLWLGGNVQTRYIILREALHSLDLTSDDVFYDLGSGYNRMPIYAGITTNATTKGVEIVPQRVEGARRIVERIGLPNVELICANVLEHDFSDGTAFYMYTPFSEETRLQVFSRLQDIAGDHPIRVTFNGPQTYVSQELFVLQEDVGRRYKDIYNVRTYSSVE